MAPATRRCKAISVSCPSKSRVKGRASFEPKIVPKGQTRFAGFNDKILSLYARGLTTREIQAHLEEIYCVEVSPTLISNVTEAVIDEVKGWQNRPLEAVYPILYLDALQVKVRDGAHVPQQGYLYRHWGDA